MGTLNEKLEYLNNTKQLIKAALEEKGQTVLSSDTFRSYAGKIEAIDTVNNQPNVNVTPSSTDQSILAESPYTGLTSVTVFGDNNLVSANIKAGVSIFNVNGNVVELNSDANNSFTISSSDNLPKTYTPTSGYNSFSSVIINGIQNLSAGNIREGVEIAGITGEYEGTVVNNQDKTVTPERNTQYIIADEGHDYTGLGVVTVEGDNNLVSENIKTGVTIFGVSGNVVELNGETQTVSLTSVLGNTFTPISPKNAITSITVTPNNKNDLVIQPSVSQQSISVPSGFSGYGDLVVNGVDNVSASNIVDGVTILGVTGNAIVLNGDVLNVTPSNVAQTWTPISPKNGFTQVNVATDQNLIPSNIKSGETIFGVTGNVVEVNYDSVNTFTIGSSNISFPKTYNPTNGYNGFSSVTISGIDNLSANNIRDGVSIAGVTGNYVGTVINNLIKNIDTDGSYTADNGYTGLGTVTVTAGAVASVATQNEIAEELMLINDGAITFTLTVSPSDATSIITSTANSVVLTPSSSSGGVSAYSISADPLKTYSYYVSKEGYNTETGTIFGGTSSKTITLTEESHEYNWNGFDEE